ncbi:MAG TPA: MoaD/ThiS family protein [Anaerolineales bacterium]|nr:MoaD/ThiS family protein [Anaerolineales bacterium]
MTEKDTIQVEVKLFASLRFGRFKKAQFEYPEGTSISDGLTHLGISERILGLALVNGQRAPLNQLLRDGDSLAIFPFVAGG